MAGNSYPLSCGQELCCFCRRRGLARCLEISGQRVDESHSDETHFRRQNAGMARKCGAERRVHISEMGLASLGLDLCTLRGQGTVLSRGPYSEDLEALGPCPPALLSPAPPSFLLPCFSRQDCLPWLPTTRKVSQTVLLEQSHPEFSPETPAFRLLYWIHVPFFSLSDKNSPFYYGKSCPPRHPPPTLRLFFAKSPTQGWVRG